jgi:hypothetical protein
VTNVRIHMKDIFVGNLDYKTSEDELRQLFAAYGPVDRVSIVTDRLFRRIEMRTARKLWQNRKEKKEWIRRLQSEDPGLEVVHPHAAGIDVGNSAHYVAVRPDRDPEPVKPSHTCSPHRLIRRASAQIINEFPREWPQLLQRAPELHSVEGSRRGTH